MFLVGGAVVGRLGIVGERAWRYERGWPVAGSMGRVLVLVEVDMIGVLLMLVVGVIVG